MTTYLLTWNESKKPWNKLNVAIRMTAKGKPHPDWWNVKAHRRIGPGDRVFVHKQGEEPRGICASGKVTSEAYQRQHWDPAKEGTTIWAVKVSLDEVIDPSDPLPRAVLDKGALANVNWNTRGSGIEIPVKAAKLLEKKWRDRLQARDHRTTDAPDGSKFRLEDIEVPPPQYRPRGQGGLGRRSKGHDRAETDARNRKLGRAGEKFVFELEKGRQSDPGSEEKVKWISDTEGDGAGYDILSYDENGGKMHIEVKTTTGGIHTPFYLTENELEQSKGMSQSYWLYRVFDFPKSPKLFRLRGPLDQALVLTPKTYEARVK